MKICLLLLLMPLAATVSATPADTLRITQEEGIKMLDNNKMPPLPNTHLIVYDPKTQHIISERDYVDNKLNGIYTVYRNNGKIWWQGAYQNDQKNGNYIVCNNDGNVERREIFVNGKVISGHCYDQDGKEVPYFTEPLSYVDEPAQPPYDLKRYLKYRMIYPESAKKENIQGRVLVKFIVMENGTVYMPIVARGIQSDCDKEALRLVKDMKRWKPGRMHGIPINQYVAIEVPFVL